MRPDYSTKFNYGYINVQTHIVSDISIQGACMTYSYASNFNLGFFQKSLELFRYVKSKHDEKIRKRIEDIFYCKAYYDEMLQKLIRLEKQANIRNSTFQ